MSILQQNQNQPTAAQRLASDSISRASNLANTIVREWVGINNNVFASENPDEVIQEIGINAKELNDLSLAIVQFLSTVLVGRRDDLLQIVLEKAQSYPQLIFKEDGSATIQK